MSHDATPCLGHGSVCAHACARGGGDEGQGRLSSALVLPVDRLSCDKHLPLTFIAQLHYGLRYRSQKTEEAFQIDKGRRML